MKGMPRLAAVSLFLAGGLVRAAEPSAAKPDREKGIITEATERARKAFDEGACLVGAEVRSGFQYSDADAADDRRLAVYHGNYFAFWFRSRTKDGDHAQKFCSPVGSTPPQGGFGPKLCFAGFGEWWSDDDAFRDSGCIRSIKVPIADALERGARKALEPGEAGLQARLRLVNKLDPAKKKLAPLKGQIVWILRGEGDQCLVIGAQNDKQLYWGSCDGVPW